MWRRAHAVRDLGRESMDYTAEHARGAGESARRMAQRAADLSRVWAEDAGSYVERHPVKAVGVAFVTGLVMGALLRR